MPAVSLRLTDEELVQLRLWATDSRRSVQREIVYRLFAERTMIERPSGSKEFKGPDLKPSQRKK